MFEFKYFWGVLGGKNKTGFNLCLFFEEEAGHFSPWINIIRIGHLSQCDEHICWAYSGVTWQQKLNKQDTLNKAQPNKMLQLVINYLINGKTKIKTNSKHDFFFFQFSVSLQIWQY